MDYPSTLFIADLSGQGSTDDLDAGARQLVTRFETMAHVERAARYRKLNELRYFVAVEVKDATDAAAGAIREALAQSPGKFKADLLVAHEVAARQRPDAGQDPRGSPIFYTVSFPVPEEQEAALGDWYDEEHIGLLQECPHWVLTRRFRVADPVPDRWGRHLAIHYLGDIEALRSPQRDAARHTPWRLQLEQEPWFRGTYSICLQEWPSVGAGSPSRVPEAAESQSQ